MKKKIFKSVAVLSAVTIICISILTVVNHFWSLTDDERFNRAVSSVMVADSFTIVYDSADKNNENYDTITAFNKEYGATNYLVNKVRVAEGGEYDGCYLIESTGRGYKSAYVKMIIGYDKNFRMIGTKPMDIDKINDFANSIDWSLLSKKVKDSSSDDKFTDTQLVALTGATPVNTLNGAAEAINISNTFINKIIKGEEEKPESVRDEALLASLDNLFNASSSAYQGVTVSEYVKYPIRTSEADITMGNITGKGRITSVYLADNIYTIIEVSVSYKTYGGWTLLVLLNNDNNTAAAISPLASNYTVTGKWDASTLDSAEVLTTELSGKTMQEVAGLDNNLNGTTSVTQTNQGLKLAVYHALDVSDEITAKLNEYKAKEGA